MFDRKNINDMLEEIKVEVEDKEKIKKEKAKALDMYDYMIGEKNVIISKKFDKIIECFNTHEFRCEVANVLKTKNEIRNNILGEEEYYSNEIIQGLLDNKNSYILDYSIINDVFWIRVKRQMDELCYHVFPINYLLDKNWIQYYENKINRIKEQNKEERRRLYEELKSEFE